MISSVRKTTKTATFTRMLQRSMYVLKIANATRNHASAFVQRSRPRAPPRRSSRRPARTTKMPSAEPEAAVRRERRRPEDVAVAELPHAGEELHEPAVEERRADPDQVRDERRVVPAEQERRQRERGEPSGAGSAAGTASIEW